MYVANRGTKPGLMQGDETIMGRARRTLLSLAVALLAVLTSAPARSQHYPAKPIRIIVPLAAGGLADTLARIVAQRLGEAAGQTVVVDNRPGGAGAIGAEAAARASADGYTLFILAACCGHIGFPLS
jgi:tripartite-type tricarboxylate transporter receptor subunit TctC